MSLYTHGKMLNRLKRKPLSHLYSIAFKGSPCQSERPNKIETYVAIDYEQPVNNGVSMFPLRLKFIQRTNRSFSINENP